MERYNFRKEELGETLYNSYVKSGYVFYVSEKGDFYVADSEEDEEVSKIGSFEEVLDYLE